MDICRNEKCTGCFACVNICPKECISMIENRVGHIYPHINETKCLNCGACKGVCPVNKPTKLNTPIKTFAAWSLDDNEHKHSASGGLASCFSRCVIKDGGIVYGCSSRIDQCVHHIRVDTESNIAELQGSKYVHSYINDCYKRIKTDLLNEKKVLFVGTPCQVAGLHNFLGKEYNQLITVDVICHGVPPQKLLMHHIKKETGTDLNGCSISFRSPKGFNLNVSKGDSVVYKKEKNKDSYYLSFYAGLCYRDSCYACDYTTSKRCSDITIGDFWGLGKSYPFEYKTFDGVSVMLVNTENGEKFAEKIKHEIFLCERNLQEAIDGNPQLRQPSKKNKNTDKFLKSYDENTDLLKYIKKERIKYSVLDVLNQNLLTKSILKRLKK